MNTDLLVIDLQSSWLATLLDGSRYIAIAIQIIHILAFTFLPALVFAFNIRVQGLGLHAIATDQFARAVQGPLVLTLVAAAGSGFLLFLPRAAFYAGNEPFVWKMGFLLTAGAVQIQLLRNAARPPRHLVHANVGTSADISPLYRAASLLALLLWLLTGVGGRVIGFV